MTCWRPAVERELPSLWPAVRAANIADSPEELAAYHSEAPWRVRLSDSGDAMVLKRWRSHLDVLALRGAWAPPHRLPQLIAEAVAVARSQGFGRLLSPLVPHGLIDAYLDAGMQELQPIVAIQGTPRRVIAALPMSTGVSLRPASVHDIVSLVALDAECFDEFWRYGEPEFLDVLARERVVACEADGAVLGYATSSLSGLTCTLGRLAVLPEARRRGVGSCLLCDAASWASRSGALAFTLCTQEENRASRSLYRKAGLVEVDERYSLAIRSTSEDARRTA